MTRLSSHLLRTASLVVTDRRWAAPLGAMALGFGLFIGVAIGPGAPGTYATGAQQIVAVPSAGEQAGTGIAAAGGGESVAIGSPGSGAGGGSGQEAAVASEFPALVSPSPFAEPPSEPPPPAEEPSTAPPLNDEAEEGGPETTELSGTVVDANPAAGSYALAIAGGELVPVHAPELPPPGARLGVEALQLANGTFAEGSRQSQGDRVRQASFRGVVTFTRPDPLAPAYTVSGRGASPLVRVPADPAGSLPVLPALGDRVTVGVGLEPGGVLLQRRIEVEPGEPSSYLDLAGIYAGLVPETGQLLLSADGVRASEADLVLTVPPGIETAAFETGDSVLATATVEPDGALKLAGIASDERRRGADDASSAQGDLKR